MKLFPQVVIPFSPLQPVVFSGTSRKSCTWGGTVTPVACKGRFMGTTRRGGQGVKLFVGQWRVTISATQKILHKTEKSNLNFHVRKFFQSENFYWGYCAILIVCLAGYWIWGTINHLSQAKPHRSRAVASTDSFTFFRERMRWLAKIFRNV